MSEIGMKPARERSFSIHEPMRISRAATDSFSALGHISRSCLQHKFDPTCAIPVYIYIVILRHRSAAGRPPHLFTPRGRWHGAVRMLFRSPRTSYVRHCGAPPWRRADRRKPSAWPSRSCGVFRMPAVQCGYELMWLANRLGYYTLGGLQFGSTKASKKHSPYQAYGFAGLFGMLRWSSGQWVPCVSGGYRSCCLCSF